jgi:hypothetical protein
MGTVCPIECLDIVCREPDFFEKHGAWLIASITGIIGMLLTYFVKSRCKRINCLGVSCVRDVVALDGTGAVITSSK